MSALPITTIVPLVTDAHGTVRVRGTRVTLDSVVVAFRAGATAEEIAQQFPTVALADVYLVIAHYLTHAAEVGRYLAERQVDATNLKKAIETRFDSTGLRARILARRLPDNAI
jgi:uncharacterized protein (DUF433 family)